MTDAFATVDGERLTAIALRVPQRGPWYAQCDFESAPEIGPRCTIKIGGMTLSGTLVEPASGVFGGQRKAMIVGGAGAWGNTVRPNDYHNDAGVKAILVAQDVAREVGETLGTFVPASERLGADYVRNDVSASRVLESVIGEDVLWWVDFAGVTNVGERPTAPSLGSNYQVLAYNPRERHVTLSLSDPSVLSIGSVVSGPALPDSGVVREYVVQVDAESVRVKAWLGGDERSAGRLASLWRSLTARASSDPLVGLYRYRVVTMAVDGRVSLQSVRKSAGLPDIEPISQWPGIPGAHAVLTPGAEVLVAFIDGDRTQPVITHYAGKGGVGFVPVSLTLGGDTGLPAARQNDTVEVLLPPAIFTGTIGVAPATGVITFPLATTLGQITTGSSKVKVAT